MLFALGKGHAAVGKSCAAMVDHVGSEVARGAIIVAAIMVVVGVVIGTMIAKRNAEKERDALKAGKK